MVEMNRTGSKKPIPLSGQKKNRNKEGQESEFELRLF